MVDMIDKAEIEITETIPETEIEGTIVTEDVGVEALESDE